MLLSPKIFADVGHFASTNCVSLESAQQRFIKYCVLEAVATDERLSRIAILRGSAALQLFYGGKRESRDMDFVILDLDGRPTHGDDPDAPKPRLNRMLNERLPILFGGHEHAEEWVRSIRIELTPAKTPYDCKRHRLTDDSTDGIEVKSVKVITPDIVVAEKLKALANLIHSRRKKERSHDVYDIAEMMMSSEIKLDVKRIGELAVTKARLERQEFSSDLFDTAGRDYAKGSYDLLRNDLGEHFIPFDVAWGYVQKLIQQIAE